jgi:hypothetical protein
MIDVSQSSSEADASAVAEHTKEPTQRLSAPITSAHSWGASIEVGIVEELG